MVYRVNPKTVGSGLLACIPQWGRCPHNCADCFVYSGGSYLEPDSTEPNMPPKVRADQVVRVNDGNDSNNDWSTVVHKTTWYPHRFFNTSIPELSFPAPVVLTINPRDMTDKDFYRLTSIPDNLMFLRFRTNLWNVEVLAAAVEYYTYNLRSVPVVLTWVCYPDKSSIPDTYIDSYEHRIHVTNPYWQVRPDMWRNTMARFQTNPYVYSCGTPWASSCSRCGNCLREWHATMERIKRLEG